jgi:hypothetical protein
MGRGGARFGLLARHALWSIAVLAVLCAAGCSSTNTNFGYPALQPTPTPVPPAPTATVASHGSAAVATSTPAPTVAPASPTVSSVTITSSASDGSWQVTFKKPVISGVAAAAATAINAAIGSTVNAYIASFTTGLPATMIGGRPSVLDGSFSVALASPTLLSLRFTVIEYATGAVGTETLAGSASFAVPSGASLELTDLFTSAAAALPVLSAQAHSQLSAHLGADVNWPASPTLSSFGAFDLTVAGLELIWSQGAVASQAEGTPSVLIPWSALASVIAPAGPAGEFLP